MSYLSKLTIIIPIAVLLIAVGFYFSDSISQTKVLSSLNRLTPTPKVVPTKADSSPVFNLKGPLVCSYATKTASYSARIKNKQIEITSIQDKKQSHFLLKGDCVYMWDISPGKKICGIGQYVGMFETFSGLGVVNIGTIIGMLPQFGVSAKSLPDQAGIEAAMQACKTEIVADEVFTVPKNILFKAESLTPSGIPKP
jgi:hypothetical protein